MKSAISIVTPSYNQGPFIERTIQSVLSQEIAGLEYLVIDGGSTDQTVSILKRYSDRLYWVSETDHGQPDAINKGISRSTAPIVGWLNSDDFYYPGALQSVLEFFGRQPEVEVLYGDCFHVDVDDRIIEKYPVEEWNWERLKEICFISQPATFLRRKVFEQHGLLDVNLRFSNDYEYWIRLGKKGARFAHLPQVLAATRLHPEASTIARRPECFRDINTFMRQHFGRAPDHFLFDYSHAIIERQNWRSMGPFAFAAAAGIISFYASLRWNGSISCNMIREMTARLRKMVNGCK